MANTKDIRTRIQSVKNTAQTTRAMKLVSAAKFRRSQAAILNARPYSKKILGIIKGVAAANRTEHFLFGQRAEIKNVLLVVITSDRGLCGSFNSSIIKFTQNYLNENKHKHEKMDMLFVGKRGNDFFFKRGIVAKEVILNLSKDIRYNYASELAKDLLEMFQAEEYQEIRLIYNEFKNALQANVVSEVLLPIVQMEDAVGETAVATFSKDFIFEPTMDKIIEVLLRKHFSAQVFRCLLESLAAEHSARMNAMENATKNAGEMIRSLTLTYNKVRQAAITTELTEIVSGAESLKG